MGDTELSRGYPVRARSPGSSGGTPPGGRGGAGLNRDRMAGPSAYVTAHGAVPPCD